jgi:hypothetical protein
MKTTKKCELCGKDAIFEDEVHGRFCSTECLEKAKCMDWIYCQCCKEDFYSDERWSGECVHCGAEYYTYEHCTEDYSDCWDEREFICKE